MDITIHPQQLQGHIFPPPSKSIAHRYLICAALASHPTHIHCPNAGEDILATVDCLNALGADISATDTGFTVTPIRAIPPQATLPCRESGSTLRFLLPVAGALGVDATFEMKGNLSQRPISPLLEEMQRFGCRINRPTDHTIRCSGKLQPGAYSLPGNISSQFISGMLLALPLIGGDCRLHIQGQLESAPYVEMTKNAIRLFQEEGPTAVAVDPDWSNAAFWLAAQALGNPITIDALNPHSLQGDRQITELLPTLADYVNLSIADTPDLLPILAVVAAHNRGACFTQIQRLRYKESDRVASTIAMIEALGGKAEATDSVLTVHGTGLTGGTVNTFADHRIAMAAGIAATVCKKNVTIAGAECVNKSYPRFWEDYRRLGGNYG